LDQPHNSAEGGVPTCFLFLPFEHRLFLSKLFFDLGNPLFCGYFFGFSSYLPRWSGPQNNFAAWCTFPTLRGTLMMLLLRTSWIVVAASAVPACGYVASPCVFFWEGVYTPSVGSPGLCVGCKARPMKQTPFSPLFSSGFVWCCLNSRLILFSPPGLNLKPQEQMPFRPPPPVAPDPVELSDLFRPSSRPQEFMTLFTFFFFSFLCRSNFIRWSSLFRKPVSWFS